MWMCRGQETGHAAVTSFTAHADLPLCNGALGQNLLNLAAVSTVVGELNVPTVSRSPDPRVRSDSAAAESLRRAAEPESLVCSVSRCQC